MGASELRSERTAFCLICYDAYAASDIEIDLPCIKLEIDQSNTTFFP